MSEQQVLCLCLRRGCCACCAHLCSTGWRLLERRLTSLRGHLLLVASILCSTCCPCCPPCCCSCPCSKVLAAIGKEVKEFYGGNHSQAALTQTTGVIVCTIEKANIM